MKLNKEIREYKTEEYLWVRQGEDCWVELDVDTLPDRDGDVFIRAKIESVDIDKRMVVVSYTDPDFSGSPDVHVTRIFKRDPNVYPELNDLVDMPVLNDAELHQKIRDRFGVLNIFTYIGPSLLIINPFKYIKEQYLESLKKEFYDCIMTPSVHKVREKPPHVWAIAAQAYLDLYNNKLNQACCISGESGAGKTVNTKTCMSFLTGMNDIFGSKTAAADPNEPRIEDKILMCNPILEALGNAKTVRNDNSSRFGKYVSLYMHNKIVIGASVESYLLEAIRVTTPNKSERNYHVFYQFMKGATDEDVNKMKLKRDPKAYLFLEKSGCYEVPTVDDIAEYKDHEKSMKTLNLLGDWRESYWRIICAVLHLSNVKFDDTYFNGSAPCDITTGNVLDDICSVLDVDRPVLEAALTTRTSIVMGKELTIFLDKSNCNSLCESFGKDIYNKLFSWVIKYLNLALLPENEKKSGQDPAKLYQKIGLLDIFGFEIFEHNSIEQLCINFTNEKLHQLYVEYVFKLEVQTFIDEGLKQFLANLSFNDNTEVLELLAHPETKRYSVFNLIDDQSATMAKDQNIVDQFGQFHGKNPKMQFSKTKKNMFFIVHTARAVGYTIDGFCEKNKDEVPRPIIRCVLSSRQKRISDIYCQKIKDSDTPVDYLGEALKKKESFISYKFRQQMDSLMNELRSCQCSFMRCIKPNEAKSATVWTSSLVVLQIRYLGLLDSIKIRKESYPFRFVFKTFVNRYLELEPEHSSKMPAELEALKPDYKQLSRNILKAAIPEHTDKTQLVGSTRVFLKIEAYQNLESAYEKAVKVKKEAVKYLDKALLELKVRTRINEIRRKSQVAVDVINTMIFGMKTKEAKRKFKILRKLVIKMQRNFRMRKALREFRKKRQSLVNIQSAIEAFVAQRKARDKFMAVKTIARYYKNYKLVSSLKWYVELLRLVRDTAKKAVEASIHKHHIKAAITIQKNVRGWLTRLQCEDEVKKIKTAKELFKYDKAIKILRKLVAGKVVRKRVKKIKNAAAKIQAYFKMRWTKHSYNHLRANTIKIQRAVKVWLKRKREKDQKRLKYFSQEYIPFLKKCMRDQSRLYPVDEESLQKTLSKERVNLRAEPPKLHKPYQQTPEFEQNPLHKMRIYSEVIDVDFIKDTFASYRDGWAAGYIDCHKDAMANKTDVRGIEVGGHHTVLSTLNAKIYCWGRNDEHQLGIEGTEETMGVFKITKDEEKLRCLAAGESHSFILTRDRTVFTFGANETGQLGLGHNQNVRKIQVNNVLTKAKLNSIHARAHESYGVTHNGELLFWPLSPSDPSIALLRFPEQEQVSTVSLGYDFAMALTLKGNIYAFGRENQKGQLGLGHTEPVLTPKLVQGPSQERFVQVSCGHSHTLAFTKNSKVYAWGAGNTGQIGLGDTSNYLIPNLVKVGSATCKPIQVCASQRGSYALCETGAIFWWGKNSRVCMLTKPTLFRNPVHPQLIPLQIRSSWSSNINITYVQMGDLRYVEAKTIGQKTALAQQISEKWNSMVEIPASPGYNNLLSAKNYESPLPAEQLVRSKPDPLNEVKKVTQISKLRERSEMKKPDNEDIYLSPQRNQRGASSVASGSKAYSQTSGVKGVEQFQINRSPLSQASPGSQKGASAQKSEPNTKQKMELLFNAEARAKQRHDLAASSEVKAPAANTTLKPLGGPAGPTSGTKASPFKSSVAKF